MSLDDILTQYGDPHDPKFEATHIVPFELPFPLIYGTAMVRKARGHRLAVSKFVSALEAVKDRELIERATHYGGIYANRSIRGFPGHTSAHAWGCAIDMNPEENQLGTAGHMDPRVVACFTELGFTWGGNFHSRKDPMHFSLLGF